MSAILEHILVAYLVLVMPWVGRRKYTMSLRRLCTATVCLATLVAGASVAKPGDRTAGSRKAKRARIEIVRPENNGHMNLVPSVVALRRQDSAARAPGARAPECDEVIRGPGNEAVKDGGGTVLIGGDRVVCWAEPAQRLFIDVTTAVADRPAYASEPAAWEVRPFALTPAPGAHVTLVIEPRAQGSSYVGGWLLRRMLPSEAAEVAPAVIPVKVFPLLGVSTPGDAEAQLDAALPDPLEAISLSDNRRKVSIAKCRDFLGLPFEHLDAEDEMEWKRLWFVGAGCVALDWVSQARPARASFLGKDLRRPAFVRTLPPFMTMALTSAEEANVERASEKCQAWEAFEPQLRLTSQRDGTMLAKGAGWSGTISLYARGDFNRDGYEDFLVRRDLGPDGGSLRVVSLFVITKTGPKDCWRLVKRLH